MPAEELRFDITANDRGASRNIKQVGDAALGTAAKLDIAAASMKLFDESTQKSGKAAATSEAAMKAHAKAANLLADAENVLAGRATQTTKLMSDQGREFSKAAKETENLAGSATDLGATLGKLGNLAMPALIGSAVALAPAIVTVGLGLTGLGAAAVGILGPIDKAAHKAGGLRANLDTLDPLQQKLAREVLSLGDAYKQFEKALAPEVVSVFNRSLHIARGLMGDLLPVSKATGQALGVLLARIDAEFRSKQWQNFFTWVGTQAAPDIKLLGDTFINLAGTLPGLLKALNPLTIELLKDVSAVTLLTKDLSQLGDSTTASGSAAAGAAKSHNILADALKSAVHSLIPELPLSQKLRDVLLKQGDAGHSAAAGIKDSGDKAKTSAVHVQSMADAVTALNNAESKALDTQLAYSNALLTAGNDAKTLRDALRASSGQVGLQTATQRASFAAANTYIGDLENAAKQSFASGRGASAAARAISAGLPILDSAKTKNRLYWQEVRTLKDWLDKLKAIAAEGPLREKVLVTGRGSWSATAALHAVAQGPGPFAAGGRVPGSGSGDTFPALLTPGEVVVPKRLVSAGVVDHLRGLLPGFATGGLVPSYSGNVAGLKPWMRTDLNATVAQITAGIARSMASAFAHAVSAASGGFADTGARSGSAAIAQSFARSILPRGWSWPALLALWNRESGWSAYAVNKSSGAYGIPQSLGHGHPYNLGDYKAQIVWGINYIAGRYGNSQAAWAHEVATGWYDRGGFLPRGLSLAWNGTPYPEQVVPHGRGGGANRIVLQFQPGTEGQLTYALVNVLTQHIRDAGGGDVQVALGTAY